jgi:hypothetical protein
MGMKPKVYDVPDAESMDVCELRLGRLARCRYPIIETTPVLDGFRVAHGIPFAMKRRSSQRRPWSAPVSIFNLASILLRDRSDMRPLPD